jgi:type II secretory pathway component PulK
MARQRLGLERKDLTYPSMPAAHPLRTLEELRRIPGVPERLALAVAPYLTVDGDGRINRAAASDTVLSAAGGSLVGEPSRLLIISRGWLNGHPLTHEIQAVYAIEGANVVLVRWQERDR